MRITSVGHVCTQVPQPMHPAILSMVMGVLVVFREWLGGRFSPLLLLRGGVGVQDQLAIAHLTDSGNRVATGRGERGFVPFAFAFAGRDGFLGRSLSLASAGASPWAQAEVASSAIARMAKSVFLIVLLLSLC